jgi:hypothetical protein
VALGAEPEERSHFTAGYHSFVWTRDERYAMFSHNDGSGAKLYDLESDPEMNSDIAGQNPDIVKRMYDGYVLRDAGGPLPVYDPLPNRRSRPAPRRNRVSPRRGRRRARG